jgi:Holliday junction resolvase RusA-like endonuclease
MYESSTRLPAWRAAVTAAVLDTLRRRPHAPIYTGPVRCTITFTIARPLSHHRTGKYAGQLFDDSPLYPVDPPDVDKLARATLDPLTLANVWFDDAGVVELHATKHYQLGQGTQPLHPDILAKPGAVIRIAPLVIP